MTQVTPAADHPWRNTRTYPKRPKEVWECGNGPPRVHLRQEIHQMHHEGIGVHKIASELNVTKDYVQRVLKGIA